MSRNNKIVPQSMCNWLLLLVFIMQFVVSFCARSVWGVFSSKPLDQYNYILIVEIFAVGIPAVLLCLFNGSGLVKTFEIKSVSFSKVWKCVGLGLCLQPVTILVNIFWQRLVNVPQGTSSAAVPSGLKEMLIVFVFTCVVPALSEEFLLRGMYLSSVKRKGYTFTIIVTTVMFVLLHADPGTVAAHAILGAAAAFAVLNTNSVYGGILVHLSFNFGGMMVDYIVNKYYMAGGFVGTFDFFLVLGVAGFILSCLFCRGVYSKKMKKIASTGILTNLFTAFFNVPVLVIIAIYILRIIM